MQYRSEIDGLRALAVLPVILFHAGVELFNGGFVGVDIFFVISGYLITSIILWEINQKKFSVINFYERRARRILPALFFVIAVSTVFSFLIFSPFQLKNYFDSTFAASTYWSNIYFWRNTNYFSGQADLQPLLHTWSLSVEEQYYLIYPFFLLLFWRLGKGKIVVMLAMAFVLSMAVSQWAVDSYPHAAFYLLVTRGWEILIGVFVAFYLYGKKDECNANAVNQLVSIVGLTLIAYSVFAFGPDTPFPGVYALVPTIGTALVILFAVTGTIVNSFLRFRVFVGIGLISYAAYLWHQPVLAFTRHLSIEPSSLNFGFSAATLVLVLSLVSYRYVETPFRKKGVVSSRTLWRLVAASVLVVVVLSVATHYTDGFKNRFDSSTHTLLEDIEESGEYIPEMFNSLRNKTFGNEFPLEKNVVLIGDSLAMDVANALHLGGYLESTNLAVHHISGRCGNLYINYSLTDNLDRTDMGRCEREGWYTDQLLQLISEADEIWLSSTWKKWQLGYLEESLRNLNRDFSARVTLFGTKKFWDGSKTFSEIMDVYEEGALVPLPDSVMSTNNELRRIATATDIRFIDVLALLCDDSSDCDLKSHESDSLITVDGGHLTKSGAQRLADRLPISLFR